jgi:hypothetical protein
MKIVDIIASPGLTGFYFDDQGALKQGPAMMVSPIPGNRLRLVLKR